MVEAIDKGNCDLRRVFVLLGIGRYVKYRMKKIEDMSDKEVIQKCHWWYEENSLVDDYKAFEKKMLSGRKFQFVVWRLCKLRIMFNLRLIDKT